jgi:hypothetical protein
VKDSECKKGTLTVQPPIPYVPPIDLHKKRDTEQIKVKLPEGINFQMSIFGQGNNEEYLFHVITVKCLLEQKGTDQDVQKSFQVVVEVRKELELLLQAQDNKTEFKKEERKEKLVNIKIKKTLKTARNLAVAKALKAYKLFRCFVVGKAQTQWDKIVHKMPRTPGWV